jgi:hypothetical protein
MPDIVNDEHGDLLEGQLIDLHRQRELHQVQTDGLRGGLPRRLFLRG